VSRPATLLIAACLAIGAACGEDNSTQLDSNTPNGGSGAPVTPVPRPPSVPGEAAAVLQTTTLGTIDRQANETPQGTGTRSLDRAACEAGVMRLETSEEDIYAELACDRFLDQESLDLFLDEQVAIVAEVSDTRFRLLLESLEGASAEFTVGGIWIEEL
jgi:hypothetical protein